MIIPPAPIRAQIAKWCQCPNLPHAQEGSWFRLGMRNVRDLDAKARALCHPREAAVACIMWGERRTTIQQLFRVEGFCDLRGVPLRTGDKFYLRALGCVRDGAPHGCHLHADPDAQDDERQVRSGS